MDQLKNTTNTIRQEIFNIQKEIMHSLLYHGADINFPTGSLGLIRHIIGNEEYPSGCIHKEAVELIEFLLEKGSNINIVVQLHYIM